MFRAFLSLQILFCFQMLMADRPNILYIMTDDHSYQTYATYDGPLKDIVKTPNLDSIANEGMRFDRCYVTNSLCGPSRATILTGKHSHANGFYANSRGQVFDGSQTTFPKVLQANGYQTALVGKWHLVSHPTGFDFWEIQQGQGLYYNPNQVIARADSNVKTLSDFKGKVFAPGVAGGTTIGETQVHFKAAGLNYPGDIKPQYVGPAEAGDLMRNKQIDGTWIMAGLPNAGVSEMCATADGRLVNIDDATFAALSKEYPWYAKFQIPAGTYPDQNEAVQTTAVKMILITDASLSEDVVYDLTKCFWENQDIVKNSHAVMKDITLEGAVTDLAGIPLHPGAAKYYKEVGVLK